MVGAVDEVLLCGLASHLDDLIAALPSAPALMMVEQVPAGWLDADTRADGLRFDHFVDGQAIGPQTRGRIFAETFEFRWEPGKGDEAGIRARYLGTMTHLEGLASPVGIDLGALAPQDATYDLWGERVNDPVALAQPKGALIYAELRIPRLLRYPVAGRPLRVRLRVREYIDPTTGMVMVSRFCGLDGGQ